MNNTGEQVADDNRKKDYTSAGSATHSLYCRLPLTPTQTKTAQTIPIIHAHIIEITSMKIVLCILVQPRLVRMVAKK